MGLSDLLRRLNDGEFDGGFTIREKHGTSTILEIRDGVPERTYNGKTVDVFDGKEHNRSNKSETIRYESDEAKEEFIQKYGFLGQLFRNDEDAVEVSKEYYEKRDTNN